MEIALWDQTPANLTWEQKVALLAHRFMQFEQEECPLEHRFEPGWYIRVIRIPKETFFIGRKHNHGHEIVLLEGECVYITSGGKHRVKAPYRLMSAPGFHAVVYAVTDVVGESRHPNSAESRDIEALELDAFEPAQALFERGRAIEEHLTWQA
jgi:hypothetical protein